MHISSLNRLGQTIRPFDAVVAISLFLGLERSHHAWTLGLLTAWIGIRCCQKVWEDHNQSGWREKNLHHIIIASLVFLQARTIIRLDDHPGASFYVLIAAGLSIGATYSAEKWMRLLRWIGCSALFLNIKLLWIGASGYPAGASANWITAANNEVFELGFGRINALSSVLATLTILCFYGARRDKNIAAKIIHSLGCISGYALCLQTDSRIAAGAPLIAAVAAFGICIKDYAASRRFKRIQKRTIATIIGLISVIGWSTAIQPELETGMASEKLRLAFWQCWLQNSILAGNGKIIHGIGYNLKTMVNACDNQSADSGLVQIIGQHGFLGALAIVLLLILMIRSFCNQRAEALKTAEQSSALHCSWSEAAMGCLLTVLLCNLTTPAYLGSFVGAALTGLSLSMNLTQESAPEPANT